MPNPNISASVSAADVQDIKDAFATITSKLPFLVNLTPGERKSIFKTGPDSVSFVTDCFAAAQNNPTIFPQSFSTTEFGKDFDLFSLLTELFTQAEQVASAIDDTRLSVGGETMRHSILVYDYVKSASKNTPGLKPLADQLGTRFKKAGSPKPPKKPTP